MTFRYLALIVAGLFTTPSVADDSFLGDWTGAVTEKGQDVQYSLKISVFERNGRVFHNTRYGAPLDCDGGGVEMERSTGPLRLSEFIVKNRYDCADGTIRIYQNGADKLIWEWFTPGGEYVARADLIREK